MGREFGTNDFVPTDANIRNSRESAELATQKLVQGFAACGIQEALRTVSRPQKWSQDEDWPEDCTVRVSQTGIPDAASPVTGKSLEWLGLYDLPRRHNIFKVNTATFGPEPKNSPATMTLEKPKKSPSYSSASVPMEGQLAMWTQPRTTIVACSDFGDTLAGSSVDGFRPPRNLSLLSCRTIPAVCKLVETPRTSQPANRLMRKPVSFTPTPHR